MEVILSIVGALAAKAAEYTVDPTARQLSYLFKPRTNFLKLRSKVQELKDVRERLQQSVDSANRKGEVIFYDIQRWLTVANEKISEEAETQLQEDEEKATKRCFAGFCPDFKSRYQLSKKADKEVNSIAQLLTQKDNFDGVSYSSHPKGIDIIRPVKEYEAFGSRSVAFDGVMAALEDDTVSIIGVYGMGGVGKTTLVKEVAGRTKEKFDEVVFVAVTQTPNAINIQNEIANQLGMELDKDPSVVVRAARLRDRLKKAKKVLVILDDIWEKQEVDTLGVPLAEQHKGCKILMTSRRLDVLKRMDSHPNISIETLKEDEAWTLFKKMAGHVVERTDLQSIAVEVAKRCAGLPIAIATIANTLKCKQDSFEWKDVLRQLSNPSERNFKGIPADAYMAIELSYKFLEGEELGPIFLLCSIMGHNAAVEDLLRYATGLGFIHDVNTIEESRNRVLTLVNNLKASCLLLEGSHQTNFDMHDVVRDVAQSIASRDLHWLALFKECPVEEKMRKSQLISLRNVKVSELNHELECPNLNYFSFGLEGSSTLRFSNNFFKGMQRLKVLEFGRTSFTALPSTIVCLRTLCILRLIDCGLKDIVILGELKNLEILDLRGSSIVVLPKAIGQLTRLKLLDLSDCDDLEVLSPNVLSKLSKLEELYLYGSFDGWEVEGNENPRSNASLVELQHLSRLTTLEVHIPDVEAIPKDNFFFGKLERYKISTGVDKWHWYHDYGMETSRMLKLRMNKSFYLFDGIKLLLGRTQSLCLDGFEDVGEMLYDPNAESFGRLRFVKVKNCYTLKNLFSFSIAKRLHQLEKLEVSNCENIIAVIVEKEEISENDILEFSKLRIFKLNNLNRFHGLWYSKNAFQSGTWLLDKKVLCPALEELYLDSVGGIDKIWHIDDQLPLMSFSVQTLTRLEVNKCHKLKYVFSSSMVKSFVQLKTLVVSECDEMEGVIEGILATEEEGISSSIRVFPKLDSLKLDELTQLKIFCYVINPIEFPLLRHLIILECPYLNTLSFDIGKSRTNVSSDQRTMAYYLFNERVILPVLEELTIYSMDNLERLWPNQLAQHSFSKLTSIVLTKCPKLVNVFPLSMLTRLRRLDSLSIEYCLSLEEIVFGSQSQGGSSSSMQSLSPQLVQSDVITFEFPSLTSLDLYALPNLTSVHHKMPAISWPSLKEMRVSGCEKVEILFASQETGGKSSQQPLFWVNESTFPNLHQLTLGFGGNALIKEIIWDCYGQQQQLLSRYFRNLEVVKLEHVIVLPSYLLSFPNLRTLEIGYSCFKEMIFQSEEGGRKKPASLLLSQITELRLDNVSELMNLWKEKEGFPNLRILHVQSCSQLKVNIVPSLVSFRNLVTLEVWWCYEIIKLIANSTAKSLVQLKEMSIRHCKKIEEIIEGRDGDDDVISFPQFNRLELEDLPKLESFCSSGNYSFGFPSLQILVPYSVSFRNLVTLKVDECDGIIKLITHSTAKSLVQLKEMSIRHCQNIEEIIQGGNDDCDEISFPQLNRLELGYLPKLGSFCSSGNYTFRFPSLETLLLFDCPKMEMFSRGDSNTPLLFEVRIDEWENKELWEGSLYSTIQQLFREKNVMIEECENSKEEQSKPSTSNTQNLIEEVQNSIKDEGSSSASNFK